MAYEDAYKQAYKHINTYARVQRIKLNDRNTAPICGNGYCMWECKMLNTMRGQRQQQEGQRQQRRRSRLRLRHHFRHHY